MDSKQHERLHYEGMTHSIAAARFGVRVLFVLAMLAAGIASAQALLDTFAQAPLDTLTQMLEESTYTQTGGYSCSEALQAKGAVACFGYHESRKLFLLEMDGLGQMYPDAATSTNDDDTVSFVIGGSAAFRVGYYEAPFPGGIIVVFED